ncbi:MAG: tyramine oxidase, partial [Actinomycetes bacterium]
MHPLDPLSAHELEQVVKHSRKAWDLKPHHLFAMVQLNEPDKETLLSNKSVERSAKVTVLDTTTAKVYEG